MPQSLVVAPEQLGKALSRFSPDFTRLVFAHYLQPPASIRKATESHAPTFHDVTNYFSREATLFWLRYHIAETFAFVGIYDTASVMQIRQTAELVLNHEIFGQLNLNEFLQFLEQFKRGDYGKIYQSARPNPQEFIACLKPFWHELVEHRIRISKQLEQKRLYENHHSPDNMTREEYEEIKMLTSMYEMKINRKNQQI